MKTFPRWVITALALMFLTLLVCGIWFYRTQERHLRQKIENELAAIAQLKVSQIVQWRADRLADAAVLMHSRFLIEGVERFLTSQPAPAHQQAGAKAEDADAILSRFRALQVHYRYSDVLLVAPNGEVRLSLRGVKGAVAGETLSALTAAVRDRRPLLTDLHIDKIEPSPHISVVAPLLMGGQTQRPIGAVILVSDARQFLYPLIQSWPTPSKTAETLLVRRDGENVLYLNDLRHQSDAALALRIPLSRTDVPAVMTALGRKGVVQGRDYRGQEVLAVLEAIPDSPWFMVAKMDKAEAFAVWRFRSVLIMGLLLGLVAFVGAAGLVVYQRNRKAHYRALYQSEAAQRASEERYRVTLMSIGDAVIATDSIGKVELLNPVAESLTGWTLEEARGKPIEEIFRIVNEETRQMVENPVGRVLREGFVVGLANHTLLIARDGTERPIADSGAPIRDEQGTIIGVVLVFRDQTQERAAQRALKESEERYQTLVEESFDGIFIQKGPKIIFANRRLSEMLGYHRSELEGKEHWSVYHPDYQELTRERANARMRGEAVPFEYQVKLQRKDGSAFDGEILARKIMFGDDPGIQVWVRDITERKRAEEALRESEERFRNIAEATSEYIWETDAQARYTYATKRMEAVYGRPLSDIVGHKPFDFMPPEEARRIRKLMSEAARRKQPFRDLDHKTLRPDGTVFWQQVSGIPLFNEDGDVAGYRGTASDITERKRAEEALEASEKRFRELFDGAPVGYHEIDKEGKIIRVNRTELDMLGYTAEEMVGRYVYEFIAGEVSPQSVKAKLVGERPVESTFERTYLRKDGTLIPVQIGETLIKDSEGRIVGIRSTIHDITERKRSEEEKATLQEQLRQSQKIEAIGRLSGGIAHDFNNILTIISGNAQLSLLDLKQGDPLRENIEEIRRASERAADLTRQLLAFSRKQMMEMKVLDLNRVVKGLDKMLHRLLGEDIDLVTVLPEGIGKVKADPGQIEQVIVNLAVNARDAMIEGGKLTIETADVELDEEYARKHIAVIPGRYVMLSISDTGMGMSPEVRERVFEPFFTTKEQGKGTGLGLSTVYGIVKQSSGNIWIYSEPGQGTTFKIYLPQVDEPLTEEKKEEVVKESPRGNETILVVEDEETVRKLAVRLLKGQGYRVLEAPDGGKALLLCEKFKERIHLILTDVVMPGMSGRKLAERLKQIHPEMKVLYMSGYTDNGILHHGILEPGINFMQKPFTLDGLARKVREALDK